MFCLPFLYLYFYCGLLFPLSRPMCFLWHKCNEEMCNRIIGISPKTRNCQRFFDTGSRPLLFEMSAFHIKSNEHLSTVILVPHFPVGDSECPNTQDTWISVPDFIAGLFDPNLFLCCHHLCCCIATRPHQAIMPLFSASGIKFEAEDIGVFLLHTASVFMFLSIPLACTLMSNFKAGPCDQP